MNADPARQASDQGRPVLSGSRARQGVTGHNVRYVLAFSIAGAVIALTLLYVLYFGPLLGI